MNTISLKRTAKLLSLIVALLLFINCSSSAPEGEGNSASAEIIVTGSLAAFSDTDVLSNSVSQNLTVKGINLSDALKVTSSANFEVSLDDTSFSNEVAISKETANAGNTTVYVRFSPIESAVGTNNGSITFKSQQATTLIKTAGGVGLSITPVIKSSIESHEFDDTGISKESDALEIVINGDHLDADINMEITDNFVVSLDNVTYSNVVQIPAASANEATTIYVKFTPDDTTDFNGTLTLSSTGAESVVVALTGKGVPVVYNYETFKDEHININGQTKINTFNMHDDNSNIERIMMYVKLRCPSGLGCNAWDVYANIKVKDPDSGDWYEIGRYITPYGVDNSALERGFEIDVTDFKSLLTGTVELFARIETWGADGWNLSVDFDYVEGVPDYPYYAVSKVLGYDQWSTSGVPYGVTIDPAVWDLDKTITIPANSESTSLRTIISGWGHATPLDTGGRGCAEWCFRTHDVKINGTSTFQHDMGPIGCNSNPISNQAGNWSPDRAGWCPGMAVPVRIDDFATPMEGSTFTFEYDYEDWVSDGGSISGQTGAYYATSTFVVVKSNTPITKPVVVD